MAATLEELLNINGVVAAGEFTADGKLVAEEVWFRRQKAEGGGGV